MRRLSSEGRIEASGMAERLGSEAIVRIGEDGLGGLDRESLESNYNTDHFFSLRSLNDGSGMI